jgi:hypothetical protein
MLHTKAIYTNEANITNMEQLTQRILYNIVRGLKPTQILRNTHITAEEFRKNILILLELKLISVYKNNNKIFYKLNDAGKIQYSLYLSDDLNFKLKIEALTNK